MFCRKCGNELPEQAKFCDKCGTKLVKEKEGEITGKSCTSLKKYIGVAVCFGVITIVSLTGLSYYTTVLIPEKKYKQAIEHEKKGEFYQAYELYMQLGVYEDSLERGERLSDTFEKEYLKAFDYAADERYVLAYQIFSVLGEYKDSVENRDKMLEKIEEIYQQAVTYFENEEYEKAEKLFEEIKEYKESSEYIKKCGDCDVVGHDYYKQYCIDNSVCLICNTVLEDATECVPGTATCVEEQRCTNCDRVMQAALGHDWGNQYPCLEGTPCVRCGANAPNHDWFNESGICTICGASIFNGWVLSGARNYTIEEIRLEEKSRDMSAYVVVQFYVEKWYELYDLKIEFFDSSYRTVWEIEFDEDNIVDYLFETSRDNVYVLKTPEMLRPLIEEIAEVTLGF